MWDLHDTILVTALKLMGLAMGLVSLLSLLSRWAGN